MEELTFKQMRRLLWIHVATAAARDPDATPSFVVNLADKVLAGFDLTFSKEKEKEIK